MKKDILFLGSQSKTRQKLLQIADIPFKTLRHKSDECGIDLESDFNKYVLSIAKHKMEALDLSNLNDCKDQKNFVLTADTLVVTTKTKEILGKPRDYNDVIQMLDLLCDQPAEVITGCCLDIKEFKDGFWKNIKEKHWTTSAVVDFCVMPEDREKYIKEIGRITEIAGGAYIEDFGQNFLKSIKGSFSAVLGLPMFELRQALKDFDFKF